MEQLHGTLPEAEQKNGDPILKIEYEAMSPLIHKIVLMVAAEYGGHISLKIIADKFRMNSTYLGQIFIKETGMKFSEYLMCTDIHKRKNEKRTGAISKRRPQKSVYPKMY